MSEANFINALRKGFRYPSAAGMLTTEQLWDLPLVAGSRVTRDVKVDLDTIARAVSAELRSITEDSFVDTKPNPRKVELTEQLDILKHIISVKQAEIQANADKQAKAVKRAKILEALAEREDLTLKGKSKEELLAELEALD